MVLADSRVVHANARENADLFWALKGGSCNFGKSLIKVFGLYEYWDWECLPNLQELSPDSR